ncbi:hypothetical protein HBE96_23140 [Clostridium sp. P21]|uniref:Uncharacterized protein n=1 Tax=Clostridium muellerianum TaxID=2716538 RepID=A0A7Y0HR59_9CLOT|nr:hypothetical protein [Clostridium muellerianum]NMM65477.1 hypothetical protein [Clostridium muellerianum]
MENLESKLEKLNEYIIESLGMELMDNRITTVKDEVEAWEKAITSDEFKNNDHTGDLEIIEELKKFIEYDCLYSINSEYGGTWGQGFIIVNKDIKYVEFVRTI